VGTDVANAERVAQPVGRTDDDHRIADPHGVGIGHRRRRGSRRHPIELQERQIGGGFGGHDAGGDGLAADELHRDFVEGVHVRRGHHLPSADTSTPEPVSVKRVWPLAVTSRPRARTTTTEGVTFSNT
jgi:hypothetical protein